MFGDYGQNKEDAADDWDDDFESSAQEKKPEAAAAEAKKAAPPAKGGFDDAYEDDFGEDSYGVVDEDLKGGKKDLFDDLAAGAKKEIKADTFNSEPKVPGDEDEKKQKKSEGEEEEEDDMTEEEHIKMVEDQFTLIYMRDE